MAADTSGSPTEAADAGEAETVFSGDCFATSEGADGPGDHDAVDGQEQSTSSVGIRKGNEEETSQSPTGDAVTEFDWLPPHIGDPGSAAYVSSRVASRAPERPDLRANWAVVGGISVLGASVRGRSHRFYGTPRQDDYQFVSDADEQTLVFAVADGVSAGSHSHAGASVAVRHGCQLLLGDYQEGQAGADRHATFGTLDWHGVVEGVARQIVGYGRNQLRNDGSHHRESDLDLEGVADAFATTLVVGIMATRPDKNGNRDLAFVAIGDTSLWLLDGSDWQMLAGRQPAEGALAMSSVAALPRLPHTRVEPVTLQLGQSQRLFAMSDGVGDAMASGASPLARYLATKWSQPPSIHAFAAHIDFARKAYDDDRTVLGIWPEQT